MIAKINHPETGEQITVDYSYIPGHRGFRGPFGEPETPADPEELEIIDAWDKSGEPIDLGQHQASVENSLLQDIKQQRKEIKC